MHRKFLKLVIPRDCATINSQTGEVNIKFGHIFTQAVGAPFTVTSPDDIVDPTMRFEYMNFKLELAKVASSYEGVARYPSESPESLRIDLTNCVDKLKRKGFIKEWTT